MVCGLRRSGPSYVLAPGEVIPGSEGTILDTATCVRPEICGEDRMYTAL